MKRNLTVIILLLAATLSDAPFAQSGSHRWVTPKGGLRARMLPGLYGKKIGVIPYKTKVRVIKEGRFQVIAGKRARWTRVSWGKKTGWVFGAFLAARNPDRKSAAPAVFIDSPANGWTALKVIKVKGRITNAEEIREARFIFNGIERNVPVRNGTFAQKVVLGAGANYIKVQATNTGGTASSALKLITNNTRMDVKVVLSWDTDGTDVDLWVTDPNNERVYYGHRRSKIGGSLDIDITNGYGPETFTLQGALPGQYLVQAQYYGGATPTMAKVLVILNEGTAKEKRLIFPALLYKTGDGITIGRFKIE